MQCVRSSNVAKREGHDPTTLEAELAALIDKLLERSGFVESKGRMRKERATAEQVAQWMSEQLAGGDYNRAVAGGLLCH
jgi:hypothetical protein